jgi:hypothetical protein
MITSNVRSDWKTGFDYYNTKIALKNQHAQGVQIAPGTPGCFATLAMTVPSQRERSGVDYRIFFL